jgi:hypothetical protein
VEPAIVPDRKSSPKRALIVLAFTVVGFFGACILVLLEWWGTIVQSDPIAAKQIQNLSCALTGKSNARV